MPKLRLSLSDHVVQCETFKKLTTATYIVPISNIRKPASGRGRLRAYEVGGSRRVHGCGRVLAGVHVGVRVGARVSEFFVETLHFLMFFFIFSAHTCLLFTVSTPRATTQFTLITAHHDRIPSQPYGYFSDYF